ncbi:mucin-4 [Drosophila tropicalis]|uniref:mucin-4 n=1 Tax=Drosophila tropicalis TaxID=46794 RepID=UPI0035ABEC34
MHVGCHIRGSKGRRDATRQTTTKMTLHLVSIIISVALFLLLWPAQLDAYITTQNTGCHHNGTWFADKSVVPSMEKCLNCQCNRKTLVCRLKVCPEMPMPPPRGCVVVQKKSTCCPYLSCARLDAFYKIPTKRRIIAYLDHYERESIDRVVNDNMLQRRSDDSDVDLFVCVKNGTVYKSGSAMSSSNLCSYCYCIGGTEKCVKPKCMLPVDGCKPIFVDSTCCPVRYDCSSKTSGKSSQEVRYRKTSNKHFQRMSQRLQRNRGCTVGSQFYVEGQKMPSDKERPCDICFCIRGTRRCAPKKCSPALKNCIPVVPKGQCCPSSYDCGSQRDYRRSQNSRQFNLYNLFFGKEEQEVEAVANAALIPENKMAERYPLDRHPTQGPLLSSGDALKASSEKSILDTLREGLEFIDGNNNKMLKDNLDLVGTTPTPTTESFLDILLGSSTEEKEEKDTKWTTSTKNSVNWMDLLLGPDEEEETVAKPTESSIELVTPPMGNIKRIAEDFDEHLESGEIAVGELPAEAQQIVSAHEEIVTSTDKAEPNLLNVLLDGLSGILDDPANETTESSSSSTSSTTTTSTTTTTVKPSVRPAPMFRPMQHTRINSKIANLTVTPPNRLDFHRRNVSSTTTTTTKTTTTKTTPKPTTTTTTTTTTPKPRTTPKITTSTTLKPRPKTTKRTTTTTKKPSATPTTSATTARTTIRTTQKPINKAKPTPKPYTTSKPLIIKTNPSILEAEPLDERAEPTLPPSLPNLKIIPFLPADAVDTNPTTNQNYYPAMASDKMDINVEQVYSPNDQASYKYQFKVETLPAEQPIHHGQFEGSASYVNYKFDQSQMRVGGVIGEVIDEPTHGKFSPPTETEGGFVPKESFSVDGEVLQDHVGTYQQVTQHLIDITTAANDTSSIEITTPDPFKDVIHTERPPNLDRLIEDKQNHSTESMTFSTSHSTSSSVSTSSTSSTSSSSSTPTTKQTPTIDKSEINKLDKLLEELLGGMEQLSTNVSTVPPFKMLPTAAAVTTRPIPSTTTAATPTTTTTAAAVTTTTLSTTTARPTARATKKGNSKTKNKPTVGGTGTRRHTTPSNRNKVRAKTTTTAIPKTTAILTTTTTTPTTARTTAATIPSTRSTTVHPFLNSPFDKLPFMDASYEVRQQQQHQMELQQQQQQQPQQFHHYQHALSSDNGNNSPTGATSNTLSNAAVAPPFAGDSSSSSSSSLMDPTGQLKLAGCNIYGRMYRVGRIIVELSSQCLECMCTEVGVKCGPLDC